MEDNGRIFKEAYRTCKREYDTLQKRYSSVSAKSSVTDRLKWMIPVLVGLALVFAAVYILVPAFRPKALYVFICAEAGLLLSFSAYTAYTLFGGRSERDSAGMTRLASIIDELDEAWVANDANEAAKRRITAEREKRQTGGSAYGVRRRVMSLADDEGKDK